MTKTKYVMSNGLAYSETKDMEMLRRRALQGWVLKRFAFAGYRFESGGREDVVFSIDYRALKADEEEEYMEMFQQAGWTLVCSEQTMHIFKAEKGTAPIYSDRDSSRDKIARLTTMFQPVVIYSVGLTFVLLLVSLLSSGLVNKISSFALVFSLVITLPAVMTLLATYYHRMKQKV